MGGGVETAVLRWTVSAGEDRHRVIGVIWYYRWMSDHEPWLIKENTRENGKRIKISSCPCPRVA